MKKFVETMAIFTTIAAIVGIICYFTKVNNYLTILYICAAASFLHSVLNVAFGDQNNLSTEKFTIILAVIVSLIFRLPIITMIALFICIFDFLFSLPGLIGMVLMFFALIASLFEK